MISVHEAEKQKKLSLQEIERFLLAAQPTRFASRRKETRDQWARFGQDLTTLARSIPP
jgi:hypothetical protein